MAKRLLVVPAARWIPVMLLVAGACTLAPPEQGPRAPRVGIIPASPLTADELRVVILDESVDPLGRSVHYQYAWERNGELQEDLRGDTVPAARTSRGDEWTVRVLPDNGLTHGHPGSASTRVENSVPELTLAFDPPRPTSGGSLRVVATATDADGDEVRLAYAWRVAGKPVENDASGDTLVLDGLRKGASIRVTVSPTDGFAEGAARSLSVSLGNGAPRVAGARLTPSSPTREQPLTLEVDGVVDPDQDAVQLVRAWRVDGLPVSGQDGAQLQPVHFRKGQRVEAIVQAADAQGPGPAARAEIQVGNAPPVVAAVTLSPAAPRESDTLTATLGAATDADGDTVSFSYRWFVDGVEVPGATGPTLTGAAFSRGQSVYVVVTPSDGESQGLGLRSGQVTVRNSAPTLGSLTLSPAQPTVESLLVAQPGAAVDADGDAVTVRFEWRVDGVQQAGESGPTLAPGRFFRGQSVEVKAYPTDGDLVGQPLGASVLVGNGRPAVATAEVEAETGDVRGAFTCVPSGWTDPDGDPASYDITWWVDGQPVANGEMLPAGLFARGQSVGCRVRPFDGVSFGDEVRSAERVVANAPPEALRVSLEPEDPRVEDVLRAQVEGLTDADGDAVTARYTWYVAGGQVPGAEAGTLGAPAFRRGQVVHVTVTPEDGRESGTPATSNPVTVRNTAPGAPSVAMEPAPPAGAPLRCELASDASDADGDVPEYAFEWTRNGVAFGGTAAGPRASQVEGADVRANDTFTCRAVAGDGQSTGPWSAVALATVPAAACGNGLTEEGEGCDDGNSSDGDGCSHACQPEAAPEPRVRVVGSAWHIQDALLPAGSTVLELGDAPDLAPGDEVLIHQAQHPTVAGRYELAFVQQIDGRRITLATPLGAAYESAPAAGPRSAQVVKVIRGTDLVVPENEEWRVQRWDGLSGGVLALDVTGTLDIRGRLELSGAGFRGGAPGINGAGCSYPWPTMAGEPGESTSGASELYAPCSRQADKVGHLVPTQANGAAGGGGAGSGINHWDFSVRSGGGGGGGAHAQDGAPGEGARTNPNGERGGPGGTRLPLAADADLLVLGPGGGGGARGVNANGGWGGHGGGAVLLRAAVVRGTGRVSVRGGTGEPGFISDDGSGGGGGGAGGTVLIHASASALEGNSFLEVSGGQGGEPGSAAESSPLFNHPNYGTGGAGGAGSPGRAVARAPERRRAASWSTCTRTSACSTSGTWTRDVEVLDCPQGSCTLLRTEQEAGTCAPNTAGLPCDDGDAATSGDACNGWGRCVGGAFATAAACVEPGVAAASCPNGMVPIPAGSFLMGRPNGLNTERPTRWTSVSAFCTDPDEATVSAVRALLPSAVTGQVDGNAPPSLLFEDGAEYCRLRGAELPTEAQWEFAARGCAGKPEGASAFGLRNMEDRGMEWTRDFYAATEPERFRDPTGPAGGHSRVLRGHRVLSVRLGAGPLDPGQLLPDQRPRAGVRCVTPAARHTGPVCGNGVVDPGESCDDGNLSNGDGCTRACETARCGDGFLHLGTERCDDGNTTSGDGCSSTCTSEHVLLLSLDGANPTYSYGWPGWTSATSFNESEDPNTTDLKTPAFAYQALSALVVEMQVAGASRHLEIPLNGETLRELFRGGQRTTTLGVAAWRGLVLNASLQQHCLLEGFNLVSPDADFTGVRLGLLANNEPDCQTPDSFVGMGVRPNSCFSTFGHTTTAGNVTACNDQSTYDDGLRDIPARVVLWGRPAGPLFVPGCGNGVREFRESCDDGNRVDGDGCSAQCVAEGCAWTEVIRHPLDSAPPGAFTRNGAHQGQWVAAVGGRMAWLQSSDWNHLFVPTGLDADEDVVAVTSEVWMLAGSNWGVGLQNESAAYNDVIKGMIYGYNPALPSLGATAYAPVNNNGICCSSPMTELFVEPVPAPLAAGQWHTVRYEASLARNTFRFYLDGVLVQELTNAPGLTWGGGYISLQGGASATWVSAEVAHSNLVVERGSPGCIP